MSRIVSGPAPRDPGLILPMGGLFEATRYGCGPLQRRVAESKNRLLAFQVMDNFRHDLGAVHQNKTPELIHREFVDAIQGRVQLRGDLIEVSIYGFQYQDAAAAILTPSGL